MPVHIYHGPGKGKTSAALGLAMRAAGAGLKVVFAQFLKDGTSSELGPLQAIGVEYLCCRESFGFFFRMDQETRERAKAAYRELFRQAMTAARGAQVLILDEACPACKLGAIDEDELIAWIARMPQDMDLVLTGRDPSPRLLALGDYITRMDDQRHPYHQGLPARKGIEY